MIHLKSSWMVCAILTMSSAQAVAQKSFKFTRENLLPKEMKSFVAPALLTKLAPDDTYKFEGTQQTIGVLPEQMNLGKGNGINVKSGAAKFTMEVYYTKKPVFKKKYDFQQPKYDGDPYAGVCIRTEYSLGVACRIKDAEGKTLVNFTVIDSNYVDKNYVGYDAAAKQIVITDKNSAKKWGTEEVAGSYFAEHAGAIQGLTAKKALDYAGNSLAQDVQLFLVGDKYSKLQYTAVAEKVQAAYPEEAKLSAEAAPLYNQWLQDVNSEKLNQQFVDLSQRFAHLNVEGKSTDYKYFVYTNAALLSAMGRDFKAANQYGLLANANDPNSWKPAVSNTLYCVYNLYMLRKLMAERPTPETLIDLAGGAASIYHKSK